MIIVTIFTKLILFVASLIVLFIFGYKWSFTYWKRKGVPTLNPTIPFGDLQNHMTRKISRMEELVNLYNTVKAKGKMFNLFEHFIVHRSRILRNISKIWQATIKNSLVIFLIELVYHSVMLVRFKFWKKKFQNHSSQVYTKYMKKY